MSFSAYSLYYFTFTQYLFSQNLNTSIYNCVSNCQEYSLKWINKTAGFVKCFLVVYLLTAISSMPDISTSVLKQKKYKTDMCSLKKKQPGFVNYKKGCTRLAATSDKVYQLLAHGRWFSPASSTTKTGRHDIAEILLKVVLKHQKSKSCYTILAFYLSKSLFYSM